MLQSFLWSIYDDYQTMNVLSVNYFYPSVAVFSIHLYEPAFQDSVLVLHHKSLQQASPDGS